MIIVAPAGSGKSYLCARDPFFKDVDHDPAVAAVFRDLTKRYGQEWWNHPDYATRIRPVKRRLLLARLTDLAALPEVQGVWLTAERPHFSAEPPRRVELWYISPLRIAQRSQERRARHLATGWKGLQPVWTLEEAQGMMDGYVRHALKWGWPISEANPINA